MIELDLREPIKERDSVCSRIHAGIQHEPPVVRVRDGALSIIKQGLV